MRKERRWRSSIFTTNDCKCDHEIVFLIGGGAAQNRGMKRKPIENFMGTPMVWHVESATMTLGEVWVKPGEEPPLHVHVREDEAWYVLEGEMVFQIGAERCEVGAGEAVVMPRGVAHGFAVRSEAARALHYYTPGGIEEAFRAGGDVPAFETRGVTFVGPPLRELL